MTVDRRSASQGDTTGRGRLQAALDQVIDMLRAAVHCERASIMLADGEGEQALLGMAAWRGEMVEEAMSARVCGDASSIAGSVYAGGRTLRVSDVDRAGGDVMARGEGGSFICAPLMLDGRVLGVINVRRARGERPFGKADEQLVECVALYAGKAIQAAQLAYVLNSGFARRAVERERAVLPRVAEAFSQGTAQPAQLARLLAKSFYREMKSAGFGPNQIVGAAGEIIDQLSASLRKHGQRIERRR
jgi:L-methionine (R)-S-oxide reductase